MTILYVNITDSAGTPYGSGPIMATRWQQRARLDKAGTFSFECAANDPQAGVIQKKREAHCWAYIDNEMQEIGAGIIDKWVKRLNSNGKVIYVVSGDDLLRELTYRSVQFLELFSLEDVEPVIGNTKGIQVNHYYSGTTNDMPAAYDGDTGTWYEMQLQTGQYLYVGFTAKTAGHLFTIGPNWNNTVATVTRQYYGDAGWTDVTVTSDGTDNSGKPFAHTGWVLWDRDDVDDWQKTTHNGAELYWMRISVNTNLDSVSWKEVGVRSDCETGTALADIMAYAPSGWSLDTVNGYASTLGTVYIPFSGDSVLTALQTIAKHLGEHFRLGAGKKVVWLRDDQPNSGYRAETGVDPEQVSDGVCLVKDLKETADTYDLLTRVYPWGAGDGSTRIGLEYCTLSESGYTLDKTNNYIQADTAVSAYGLIEQHISWPEIGLADDNVVHSELASNELFQTALEHLKQYSQPQYSYDITLLHTGILYPGSTLYLSAHRYLDGIDVLDIEGDRVILEAINEVDENGIHTSQVTASTTDVWPDSDARYVASTIQKLSKSSSTSSNGSGSRVVTVDGLTAQQHFDIGDGAPHHPGLTLDAATDAALVLTESAQILKLVKSWLTAAEHATIGNGSPHHAPITLGAGCDSALSLINQTLTLADVLTPVEHTAIGNNSPHHIPANAGDGIATITSAQVVSLDLDYDATWTGLHVFEDDVTFNDPVIINDALTVNSTTALKGNTNARNLYPETTDAYDLGSSTKLWHKGWLSELDTILFAENTIQLSGGWQAIAHDAGTIPSDVASTDTTIDFGKIMTPGDWVVFRTSLQVEYMLIGASTGTDHFYKVGADSSGARDLDGSGANDWPAGSVFMVLGQLNDGRIELSASDYPRISLLVQNADSASHPTDYDDVVERVRIGSLRGWGNYGSNDVWGAAFGEYGADKSAITIDPTNGVRIWGDNAVRAAWGNDGAITIGGTGAGKAGITLDDTNGMQLYSNGLVTGKWGVDGEIIFGRVATDSPNIHRNPSTGNLEFRGGVDGEEVQSIINSDGAFKSGDGKTVIDEKGIVLLPSQTSVSWDGSSSREGSRIVWQTGSPDLDIIGGVSVDYFSYYYYTRLFAYDYGDNYYGISLITSGSGSGGAISLFGNSTFANDVNIQGTNGLNVSQNITVGSGKYLGLGSSAARVEFDTGEVKVRDATLGAIRDSVAVYRDVAHYYNSNDPVTGTLKIKVPKVFAMLRITVQGYDYSTRGYWECRIGAYPYPSETTWYSYSASIIGNAPFSDVRLAWDSNGPCILLGTTATTWRYPSISIDVQSSYIQYDYAIIGTAWSMSLITSESGITIKATLSPILQTTALRITVSDPPSSASDTGVAGEIRWDSNYLYVYVGTGWKRVGIATW